MLMPSAVVVTVTQKLHSTQGQFVQKWILCTSMNILVVLPSSPECNFNPRFSRHYLQQSGAAAWLALSRFHDMQEEQNCRKKRSLHTRWNIVTSTVFPQPFFCKWKRRSGLRRKKPQCSLEKRNLIISRFLCYSTLSVVWLDSYVYEMRSQKGKRQNSFFFFLLSV